VEAATGAATAEILLPVLDGVVETAPSSLSRRPVWDTPFPPVEKMREQAAAAADVVDLGLYQRSKAEREHAEAEMSKLKLAELRGKLIDAREAQKTFTAIGRMFAQAREMGPAQLAPKLVGLTDPKAIEGIVREHFRDLDRRVADEIKTRFTDVVPDVGLGSVASC
jgi:hypothetical protein